MMNLTITDKEVKATDAIKDYVEKKNAKNWKILWRRKFWC